MATNPTAIGQVSGTDRFHPASSFIELVEYDPKHYTLDITFKTGSVHRYLFCFPTTYQSFKESPTHDAYFSKLIRGKLLSIAIRTHTVGRERSHPLKPKIKRRHLEIGTLARAGL